jgi:hypothetical protein
MAVAAVLVPYGHQDPELIMPAAEALRVTAPAEAD